MIKQNVVMSSDLARFLILYELGGMYLDIDQVIIEFDERLLSYDFVGYTTDEFSFGYWVAETSFMATIPKFPLILEYFRQAREFAYMAPNSTINGQSFMHSSKCFSESFFKNMQATGPFRLTAAFD